MISNRTTCSKVGRKLSAQIQRPLTPNDATPRPGWAQLLSHAPPREPPPSHAPPVHHFHSPSQASPSRRSRRSHAHASTHARPRSHTPHNTPHNTCQTLVTARAHTRARRCTRTATGGFDPPPCANTRARPKRQKRQTPNRFPPLVPKETALCRSLRPRGERIVAAPQRHLAAAPASHHLHPSLVACQSPAVQPACTALRGAVVASKLGSTALQKCDAGERGGCVCRRAPDLIRRAPCAPQSTRPRNQRGKGSPSAPMHA